MTTQSSENAFDTGASLFHSETPRIDHLGSIEDLQKREKERVLREEIHAALQATLDAKEIPEHGGIIEMEDKLRALLFNPEMSEVERHRGEDFLTALINETERRAELVIRMCNGKGWKANVIRDDSPDITHTGSISSGSVTYKLSLSQRK